MQITKPERNTFCSSKFGWLAVAGAILSMTSISAGLAEDVCPDMPSHQEVLREGVRFLKSEPSTVTDSGGGRHLSNLDLYSGIRRRVLPTSETDLWSLPPSTAATLPLDTDGQIGTALSCADTFELRSEFAAAAKLYGRIVEQCESQRHSNTYFLESARCGREIANVLAAHTNALNGKKLASEFDASIASSSIQALQNIERRSALGRSDGGVLLQQVVKMQRDAVNVPTTFDRTLDDLDASNQISVRTKLRFFEYATNDRILSSKLAQNNDGSSDAQSNALKHANSLAKKYRMALECLRMADDLDETALKLENQNSYDEAIKLFSDSLEIKEKNLGPLSADTVEQYGAIAHVYEAEQKYDKAENLYGHAYEQFQKLSRRGDGYKTFLCDYADILKAAGHTAKAATIRAEAARLEDK